jgi:hypothetical protein
MPTERKQLMSKRSRSRATSGWFGSGGFVAAGLLLVVVAAACGSSSPKVAASAATTTTVAGGRGANTAALAAYRTCLSQHGVKLPTRTPGSRPPTSSTGGTGGAGGGGFGGGFGGGGFGGGANASPQFAAAQKACASKLPKGGFGFGGRGGGAGGAAFTAYISCMKDHGITIANRTTSTTVAGATTTSVAPVDRTSAKFIAANKVCQALLPARPGTTTTTAG